MRDGNVAALASWKLALRRNRALPVAAADPQKPGSVGKPDEQLKLFRLFGQEKTRQEGSRFLGLRAAPFRDVLLLASVLQAASRFCLMQNRAETQR